ncbi:phosphomannomutase [Aspergillus clavatus NRRL 1]|uniref:Phosphoglucomutase, putative n=1 Tax=Aspergillus clavatus (strain ATCC 1007 / CBS 513.65 / DSM 816 / NCTC 3887 / NRRL 1 / QM 1276 / 107) TaxID=344612 RepID=A1CCD1_ASPCL|nr:phosphoglucomutase, putative [Aspergillus clavatus NRRL 1]EAW12188.1 phosphoglucomutase, putative [Aspergillus clavatus NRRL 1]
MAAGSLSDPLIAHLNYEPVPLKFGTSGRRGKVVDLTQLEIYTNVRAELRYLQSLPLSEGGIRVGDDFYFAYDLRPSSTSYVKDNRGGLSQAVVQAAKDAGMHPINLGAIPTPALTYFALRNGKGSIMVTGSHIPFDRNGYKLNTSQGELLKKDEQPINELVKITREELLSQPFAESLFNEHGMLRDGSSELPPIAPEGKDAYVQRYLDFFEGQSLEGKRILVYQHSAVGRDVAVEILQKLGAKVAIAGRSETFVPIDTEAIDAVQLNTIQVLYDSTGQTFDAVVSTDGDSDRPLILAPEGDRLRFFGGDLLGMVVAEYLQADAVVVPISTNDAIDRGSLADATEPKTKIGSPYVIAGMQDAIAKGRRRVCGWEANGGFLTGSDIERNGKMLTALPTRDAALPLLCALFAAQSRQITLPQLFSTLPRRFSRAALIRNFPRSTSMRILQRFSPSGSADQPDERIRSELETVFSPDVGFTAIARIDYTDGVRLIFENGDVAHFRPSGNADELRIYAVADTQERADGIAARGTAEPDGLLRKLERMV